MYQELNSNLDGSSKYSQTFSTCDHKPEIRSVCTAWHYLRWRFVPLSHRPLPRFQSFSRNLESVHVQVLLLNSRACSVLARLMSFVRPHLKLRLCAAAVADGAVSAVSVAPRAWSREKKKSDTWVIKSLRLVHVVKRTVRLSPHMGRNRASDLLF